MKHGKKYTEAAKLIDRAKTYEIEEAAPHQADRYCKV